MAKMRLNNEMRRAFVRAVMADVPQVDYEQKAIVVAMQSAEDAMPMVVLQAYKSHPEYFATRYHANAGFNHMSLPVALKFQHSEKATKKFLELSQARDKQQETRATLEATITAAIANCRYREDAVEQLPEFEKYLPAGPEALVKYPLVVAGIGDMFKKAGFPAGKEPAK